MSCRWVASDHPRVLSGRHGDDCTGECRGCLPCPEPHCRVCGLTHADGTCAECLAETREALRDIARMCDSLPEEVEHRGVAGEAMMLLGPAADPEARGHLEASVLAGRVSADYLDEADGELHPLFVLGSWDGVWRDALEHDEPAERLTVATATDYLDRQLTYMAGYEHVPFEDFARDLRQCRAHLASVLHDGEQVEKGAPCLKCKRPLTRTTDDAGKVAHRCERCRRDLTENEYRMAIKAAHIAHSDRLNTDDLAIRIGVPSSTVRRWVSVERVQRKGQPVTERPPLMYPCGRDGNGRKVYRVSDAERVRDGVCILPTARDSLSNEGADESALDTLRGHRPGAFVMSGGE